MRLILDYSNQGHLTPILILEPDELNLVKKKMEGGKYHLPYYLILHLEGKGFRIEINENSDRLTIKRHDFPKNIDERIPPFVPTPDIFSQILQRLFGPNLVENFFNIFNKEKTPIAKNLDELTKRYQKAYTQYSHIGKQIFNYVSNLSSDLFLEIEAIGSRKFSKEIPHLEQIVSSTQIDADIKKSAEKWLGYFKYQRLRLRAYNSSKSTNQYTAETSNYFAKKFSAGNYTVADFIFFNAEIKNTELLEKLKAEINRIFKESPFFRPLLLIAAWAAVFGWGKNPRDFLKIVGSDNLNEKGHADIASHTIRLYITESSDLTQIISTIFHEIAHFNDLAYHNFYYLDPKDTQNKKKWKKLTEDFPAWLPFAKSHDFNYENYPKRLWAHEFLARQTQNLLRPTNERLQFPSDMGREVDEQYNLFLANTKACLEKFFQENGLAFLSPKVGLFFESDTAVKLNQNDCYLINNARAWSCSITEAKLAAEIYKNKDPLGKISELRKNGELEINIFWAIYFYPDSPQQHLDESLQQLRNKLPPEDYKNFVLEAIAAILNANKLKYLSLLKTLLKEKTELSNLAKKLNFRIITAIDLIDLLIEHDFPPNSEDKNDETFFHYLIFQNRNEQVNRILNKNSKYLSLIGSKGYHPINAAAAGGNLEFISKFYKQDDPQVNLKNSNQRTCLHLAVQFEETETVEKLLAFTSLEINARDKFGFTAIFLAFQSRNEETIKLLLASPRIELNDSELLHFAVLTNQFHFFEPYLRKLNLNLQNELGLTLLHTATLIKNPVLMHQLFKNGANPNLKNSFEKSPGELFSFTRLLAQNHIYEPKLPFAEGLEKILEKTKNSLNNNSSENTNSFWKKPDENNNNPFGESFTPSFPP